ncbi:MBOAT family protein [Ruminococcaceae bacterium OttesenSCG-928-A16]|nr:MBOAT family protein [Ruminococcaceae bacterium OttesenSCG-928-A16]
MVFSSVPFLFYFLPVLIIVYVITPKKLKNGVMILASMVFFAWGEIRFIPVMLALSVVDFVCGRMMEQNRDNQKRRLAFMLIGVGANLFVLLFFKYTNFFVANINGVLGTAIPDPNIILPIGVSFNSFQSMSYAIDVYRGTTRAEKKYYDYLCYTTLFPQIIAGPIVRYVTVEKDLDDHEITRDGFSEGMRRFLIGLGKKVLIANNVGLLWSQVSAGTAGQPTVMLYWLGIIAYTFQIYFDFSGYSDMAIGLARVFGLTFDENFDTPYIAKSITEFWRRWHITLSAWFRDYIYIPMGGNRKGKLRQMLNIFVVWALTGFWHGASWNFVLWGLYFAVLLVFEKFVLFRFWQKVPKVFQHVYTMLLVIISWVIFAADDLVGVTLGQYLAGLFGLGNLPLYNNGALFYLLQYAIIFVVAAYFATPHFKTRVLQPAEKNQSKLLWGFTTAGYVIVFLACVAFIVNSSYNPFLYFRF